MASLKNRLQAMSARQEQKQAKLAAAAKAPTVETKAAVTQPSAPVVEPLAIGQTILPQAAANKQQEPELETAVADSLGLDSLLTMTPDQIQKISPTGQFSKLKASLAAAEVKVAKAEVVMAAALEPVVTSIKQSTQTAKPLCLNDLLSGL